MSEYIVNYEVLGESKKSIQDMKIDKYTSLSAKEFFVNTFSNLIDIKLPAELVKKDSKIDKSIFDETINIDMDSNSIKVEYDNPHLIRALDFFGFPVTSAIRDIIRNSAQSQQAVSDQPQQAISDQPQQAVSDQVQPEISNQVQQPTITITRSALWKHIRRNFLGYNPNRFKDKSLAGKCKSVLHVISIPFKTFFSLLGLLGGTASNLLKVLVEYPLFLAKEACFLGVTACLAKIGSQDSSRFEKVIFGLISLLCILPLMIFKIAHTAVRIVTSPIASAKAGWEWGHLWGRIITSKKDSILGNVLGGIFGGISIVLSIGAYVALAKVAAVKVAAKIPQIVSEGPKWLQTAYRFITTNPVIDKILSVFAKPVNWLLGKLGHIAPVLNANNGLNGVVGVVTAVGVVSTTAVAVAPTATAVIPKAAGAASAAAKSSYDGITERLNASLKVKPQEKQEIKIVNLVEKNKPGCLDSFFGMFRKNKRNDAFIVSSTESQAPSSDSTLTSALTLSSDT